MTTKKDKANYEKLRDVVLAVDGDFTDLAMLNAIINYHARSKENLARYIGCSESYLHRIFRNERTLSDDIRQKIYEKYPFFVKK